MEQEPSTEFLAKHAKYLDEVEERARAREIRMAESHARTERSLENIAVLIKDSTVENKLNELIASQKEHNDRMIALLSSACQEEESF